MGQVDVELHNYIYSELKRQNLEQFLNGHLLSICVALGTLASNGIEGNKKGVSRAVGAPSRSFCHSPEHKENIFVSSCALLRSRPNMHAVITQAPAQVLAAVY